MHNRSMLEYSQEHRGCSQTGAEMNIIGMNFETFSAMRVNNSIRAFQAYHVDEQYGFSPDGIGMYWYDIKEELLANH